ncbi:hypothetical protein BY996DRAFT_4577631 [Phakopsora pachyrhizi]|nr:hypothetical protein BY996DRAFT_4577631 [Phakopsora pachyrhizi]
MQDKLSVKQSPLTLTELNAFAQCSSGLDILSSVAEADFLRSITSVDLLTENEAAAIETLNNISTLAGSTAEIAAAARQIIVDFRQSQNESKSGKNYSDFDRMMYLLDRYLDYCSSVNLTAWPIDHLKISIWIKNDVIVTTNSTRMKPLRKTVRCYVTSLESIRIKTLHLFKGNFFGLQLMKSKTILEILSGLSLDRDNLVERLGGNQTLLSPMSCNNETPSERDSLIQAIRSNSGDALSAEALTAVKVSRSGELQLGGKKDSSGAKSKSKSKPDPHIHTLKRYRNFCFLNQIPMWPIDSPRVALWLRESVLTIDARSKNKSGVSFRTIQVYLSRLEYARVKTEHLFQNCPNYGVSLYKSKEITDILKDLNPINSDKASNSDKNDDDRGKLDDTSYENVQACTSTDQRISIADTYPRWPTALRALDNGSIKKRKFQSVFDELEVHKEREIKNKKRCKPNSHISSENVEVTGTPRIKSRLVSREVSGRRNLSVKILRLDTAPKFSKSFQIKNTLSTPSKTECIRFPPISQWFSPPSPSPSKKKGCLSFILCSEEDSDVSSTSQSANEALTPFGSPSRESTSTKISQHYSSINISESPTFNRFWSLHSLAEP